MTLWEPADSHGYWIANIAYPIYNFPISSTSEAIIAFCNYGTPILFSIGIWISSYFLGERIVSVRELSTQLAVNSRTVLKAYEYLQAEDIIYPERGMGFYLSKDAMKKVMKIQKKEFFENQLADLFSIMDLLGISIDEITERYNKLKNSSS